MNYLSATIPNYPPDFEFNQPPEKRSHTEKEIEVYVFKVESLFNLPAGILSTPRRHTVNGIMLTEVKRAAIYHLASLTKNRFEDMAPLFGVKCRTGICRYIKKAKWFVQTNDEIFTRYYEIVSRVAV